MVVKRQLIRKYFVFLIFVLFFSMAITAYGADEKKIASDYIKSGWRLMHDGNLEEASLAFQKAVELNPKSTDALRGLGRTFMYLGENQKAEEALVKALELDPGNVDSIILLATLYSWNNRFKESTDLYKKALKIDPQNVKAKTGLAETYSWGGQYGESISRYEEILVQEPRYAKAHKGLAEAYMWDNRLKEAELVYIEALDIWPDDVELRMGLARVYGWMSLWSKAEKEYAKILDIDPGNAKALEGIKDAKKALLPQHDIIFRLIRELDGNNWKALTVTQGYKYTLFSDYGNNFFAAYYLDYFEETTYGNKIGNTVEIGGKYNFENMLTLLGSVNMRTYKDRPDFFAGANVDAILKYSGNNTLTFKYARNLFDIFDNIKSNRYGVESNIYLTPSLFLTDNFFYSSYSDDNNSSDTFHNITFIASKKKPDLNLSIGYRWRDFKNDSTLYYSPQSLNSISFSAFLGGTVFNNTYTYGLLKFNHLYDADDEYYYLLGCDYSLNDNISLAGEVSYFDTEGKYESLFVFITLKAKF